MWSGRDEEHNDKMQERKQQRNQQLWRVWELKIDPRITALSSLAVAIVGHTITPRITGLSSHRTLVVE
ncbi:hypothetical protein J6590_039217 [Homalodisca vitripennis]|nr:hypothetical protein J6590_039217 [Homalodisca vitripennis]